jgi:hypothetical protein
MLYWGEPTAGGDAIAEPANRSEAVTAPADFMNFALNGDIFISLLSLFLPSVKSKLT